MQHLSDQTIRLLSSAQVITSVLSAVKELLENALDAGGDSIEVKLESFGLDKIEVRDNGSGIAAGDVPLMGQRHYTSKLSDFHDLTTVTSYGFRGEALASLCAVADVSVTTKQACDEVSRIHVLNHNGEVTTTKPSHLGNGTTVTATSMFKTLPVRLQYYNSSSRKKDELRRLTDLMMCYGYVNPGVRLTLSHNKRVIWQKNKVSSCRVALMNTVGANVMNQLAEVEQYDDETGVSLQGFLPRRGSDPQLVGRAQNDRCWMYINKRPVTFREAEKLIKQSYSQSLTEGPPVKNVVACIHFLLPTESVDVNLEPDKRKVLLQNKDAVLTILTQAVGEVYAKPKTPPRRRQDSSKAVDQALPEATQTTNSNSINQKSDGCQSRTKLDSDDLNEEAKNSLEMDASEERGTSGNMMATETRTSPAEEVGRTGGETLPASQIPESGSTDTDEPSFSLFDDKLFQDTQVSDPQQPPGGEARNDGESAGLSDEHGSGNLPGLDLTSIIRSASETATKDIQQFEKVFGDDPERLSAGSLGEDNAHPPVEQNSADQRVMTVPHLEPTEEESVSREGNISDWSKGVLLGTKNTPVEPVKLLVPGSSGSTFHVPRESIGSCGSEKRSNVGVHEHIGDPSGDLKERDLPRTGVTMAGSDKLGSTEGSPGQCQGSGASSCSSTTQGRGQSPPHGQSSKTGTTSAPSNNDTTIGEPVVPSDGEAAAVKHTIDISGGSSLGGGVPSSTPTRPPDGSHRSPGCRPGGTLEGYKIPKVSECIPAQKASTAHQGILNGQQSTGKQLPASVKKKSPTAPGNPTKKKRTSKKKQLISNQGLINEMLASQGQRQVLPPVTTTKVPFSTTSLSRFIQDSTRHHDKAEQDKLRLVCKLRQLWVVLEGSEVLLFNHFRAEEVVLYHRLLSTHVLPAVTLDVPITLNKSIFNSLSPWLTLLSLETSRTGESGISEYMDQRLLANGFKIRRLLDKDNRDVVLQITAIADLIPCYGTEDLQEILNHISDSPAVKLKGCRPLKVSNYLKGEAVRVARNRQPSLSMEDAQELITAVQNIGSAPSTCLHGQPLFTELCSLKK